jgi:site-specific DNA-methyltransferase (cytosine-N4-specific)
MLSLINRLNKIDWNFPNSNTAGGINSIHPYPAKFIQEIPKELIGIIGVPKGTCVFDPFCGSGATLVEAQLAGKPSIGIDLNPIACLISRVKTQPLTSSFMECVKHVINSAQSYTKITIPQIPNLDHWFMPEIQETTAKLLLSIESVKEQRIKDALRLALSSVLVRVSNQESDTRYAAINKDIDANKYYSLFSRAAEHLWKVKNAYKPKFYNTEVLCKDTLAVTKKEIKQPVGLVITSPPYPNAYEYWLYHKYRMFWLGFDPIQVKRNEIGARAHYYKKNPPTANDFHNQMVTLFNLFWDVVVKNGYVCVVIGRSKVHGKIIDNASIINDVGKLVGFTPMLKLSRLIASSRKTFNLSHANIINENILIFRK